MYDIPIGELINPILQIHQARQFQAKPENTVHSNVTAEPSTLAVSPNALKNIPKAPFQSLGIE